MTLLARVAESIYWMARYLERAEDTARLVSVNAELLLDLPRAQSPGWGPLISILGMDQDYYARFPGAAEERVIAFLTGDRENRSSILSCLHAARENARGTREIVPRPVWEAINHLHHATARRLERPLGRYDLVGFLEGVSTGYQKIKGLISGTMTQDEAYDMLMLGRRMERADMTTRIVDVRAANLMAVDRDATAPYDAILWTNILKSLSGEHMYKRWQPRVSAEAVLRFVLQYPEFPRSVAHCLADAKRRLACLPQNARSLARIAELEVLLATARLTRIDRSALHGFLDQIQAALGNLHSAIAETYFDVRAVGAGENGGQDSGEREGQRQTRGASLDQARGQGQKQEQGTREG
jgi:uncharacterized alpha-E superfamily protein